MARIAVGGLQHETNTFAPVKADLHAFNSVADHPRMPRGETLISEVTPLNLPIGGFIQAATERGHELKPCIWATAVPSAHVTDDAYEHIVNALLEDVTKAGAVDAVYLCLHGAMVTESHEDGEGELLRRVRNAVGEQMPIVASLDLHANVTRAMVEYSDALVAFRTYPHVDMATTGKRAAELLQWMLDTGRRPAKAWRQLEFLIPLVWQCTLIEPADAIYAGMQRLEADLDLLSVSFTPGFPLADIADCGPAVLAYARSEGAAEEAVAQLFTRVDDARERWSGELLTPDDAVSRAIAEFKGKPFVLADTQDNPGAGGASDTVGLLESLVRLNAQDAVFAHLYDEPAARAAHAAGVGASITCELGASSGQQGHTPFAGTFTVEALSDGEFVGTGPMSAGTRFQLGPTALLRIGGVRIIVVSGRSQVLDQQSLRHIGVDPSAQRILAIKSSVHFRADFQSLAQDIFVVEAPGPNMANHHKIAYQNLRDGVCIAPDGGPFKSQTP